jgi:hypothetical protein
MSYPVLDKYIFNGSRPAPNSKEGFLVQMKAARDSRPICQG